MMKTGEEVLDCAEVWFDLAVGSEHNGWLFRSA